MSRFPLDRLLMPAAAAMLLGAFLVAPAGAMGHPLVAPTPTPISLPQGLAGPAAPPAPETPFHNRIFAEGGSYVLEYTAPGERLRYRYTPATGALYDLTVEVENLPPFWPSFFGGPVFVFGEQEIPIWESDTLTWSHTAPRVTPNSLEITWRVAKDAQEITYAYRFSIHGKTLRVQVDAQGDDIRAFSLDRSEATPGARIVSIPYLATFDLLLYQDYLVSLYFDWTESHASHVHKVSQPYSAQSFHFSQMAFYEPDTAGVRVPLHEVVYLTVSDRLAEVLPMIPNSPSPYREILAGRVMVDLWTEAPFAESQALVEALHRRGVSDLLVIRHTWQRCGYDDCYPSVLPAHATWGGDAGLRALAAAARRAGYLFAVHENYTDFYPNSDRWSPEYLALDAQGNWRPAWFNQTTQRQSYLLSPFRALAFARELAPEIHRRYRTTAAFVDVVTAVPPWEKTDHNARLAGRARFVPVFQAYADLLSFLRTAHQGPVLGEGGAHFLYAGLVDGVAAAYQDGLADGTKVPPLVDFALLRLHPLMVSYGVGYFPYYFRQDGQPKWSGYSLEEHYHYMATEIAFCHAGYVDSPEGFTNTAAWLDWVEREAHLVAPVHQRCAQTRPVRIRYRVDGALVGVEQALAADQGWQVRVEYENGLQVYVNRHPNAAWPITLDFTPAWVDYSALISGTRQDFVGIPRISSWILPPNGWLVFQP
ncbi:MAG: DUF5696 domain-containing protein [Anaerolineae bacterium]|nr:DUF5696 domain-containing protein [Anaerolineae bacterium]